MELKMKKLDLHGVKHENVRPKVIRFIEDNWDSGDTVRIVTGHSESMQKLACDIIDEYDLWWKIGDTFGFDSSYIQVTME
jgi:hypothetical protein